MNGQLMENLNRLESCVSSLGALLGMARREGRIPSLDEAQRAAVLSHELLEILQEMPAKPCEGIADPVIRQEVEGRMGSIKQVFADLLEPAKRVQSQVSRSGRAPLPAAGAVRLYGSF